MPYSEIFPAPLYVSSSLSPSTFIPFSSSHSLCPLLYTQGGNEEIHIDEGVVKSLFASDYETKVCARCNVYLPYQCCSLHACLHCDAALLVCPTSCCGNDKCANGSYFTQQATASPLTRPLLQPEGSLPVSRHSMQYTLCTPTYHT